MIVNFLYQSGKSVLVSSSVNRKVFLSSLREWQNSVANRLTYLVQHPLPMYNPSHICWGSIPRLRSSDWSLHTRGHHLWPPRTQRHPCPGGVHRHGEGRSDRGPCGIEPWVLRRSPTWQAGSTAFHRLCTQNYNKNIWFWLVGWFVCWFVCLTWLLTLC